MYTATLIGDTKNIELRRRMINVEFTNGTVTFAKEFQFSVGDTVEVMKRTVKQYLDELNFVPPTITGAIDDVPTEVVVVPTAAELAKIEYEQDVARLKKAKELLDLGVVLKPAFMTAISNLQTKIANDIKAEYLG